MSFVTLWLSYGLKTCQQPPHPFVLVAHFASPYKTGLICVFKVFRFARRRNDALRFGLRCHTQPMEGLGVGLKTGNAPTRQQTSVLYYIVVRICRLREKKKHTAGEHVHLETFSTDRSDQASASTDSLRAARSISPHRDRRWCV